MAQINNYADKTAYNNDSTRLRTKSAVSHIEADGATIYDGVNVVVDKSAAESGDLIVFDKVENRNRFVKAKTLVKNQLPAHLVAHSVVLFRRGDLVYFTPLTNAGSARWAHSYEVALNGINVAIAGTLAIVVHNNGSVVEEVDVNWTAGTTLEAIAASISNGFTQLGDADNKTWTAAAVGTQIILSHNYYLKDTVDLVTGTGGGSGVSFVADEHNWQIEYAYLNTTEQVRRKNGVSSYYAGCHLKKNVEYYSTNGTEPTGNVPIGSSTIVKRSAFDESDYCADLRATYPDYESYLSGEHFYDRMSRYASQKRDGKTNTEILAALKGTTVRGNDEPRYPAATMAHDFAIHIDGVDDAVVGLGSGKWWLPDNNEMYDTISPRRLNASDTAPDPVNDTIVKMGGSPIYGSGYYPWTSCECSAATAFVFHGTNGGLNYNNKCDSGTVRPVSAF